MQFTLFTILASNENLLYEALIDNYTLRVSLKSKTVFSKTFKTLEIVVNDLPAIKISEYALQFSNNVSYYQFLQNQYNKFENSKLTEPSLNLLNSDRYKLILFVNPLKYSKSNFLEIKTCLTIHAKNLENSLNEKSSKSDFSCLHPHFISLVYADPLDLKLNSIEKNNLQTA